MDAPVKTLRLLLVEDRVPLAPAAAAVLERKRLRMENHRVEDELQKTGVRLGEEQLYRASFDHAVSGIGQTSITGEFLRVNQKLCDMLGYSAEELLARTFVDVTHPDDVAMTQDLRRELLANRAETQLTPLETRYTRKDGSTIWVALSASLVFKANGEPDYFVAMMQDVSDRKAAEEKFRATFEQATTSRMQAELLLKESESRFRSLTELSADWYWEQDTEYKFTEPSGRPDNHAGRMWGNDAIIGKARWELPYLETSEVQWKAHKADLTARRAYHDFELKQLRPDGEVRYLSVSGQPMYDAEGRFTGYCGVGRDITGRKIHENKIANLSRVHAVLSGINSLIVRVRDRQELFAGACKIAVEDGKFALAWIGLLDAKTLEVTPAAVEGIDPGAFFSIPISARAGEALGHGTVGCAIREKRTIYSNDLAAETDPRIGRRLQAIRLGYRSRIVLPLIVHGAAVGNLSLYSREPNFFTDEELKLLKGLAEDISFALEYIDKDEKVARLSRVRSVTSEINFLIVRVRDRQELFDEVCRVAVEHGKFDTAWIGALDSKTLTLTPIASAGSDKLRHTWIGPEWAFDVAKGMGVGGRAIREKRPVFDNDIAADPTAHNALRMQIMKAGIRSIIALPFIVDGAVTGQLTLYSKQPNYFNEDEVKLLAELAGNISFAIEHIDRQKKLDKLSRIRAVSGEVNAAIVRINDQEALLRETCRIISDEGKFGLVWVASLDVEKQAVRPIAWTGFSAEIANAVTWTRVREGTSSLAEIINTRCPAVRNDIESAGPAGPLRAEAIKQGCLSTLCLPLLVDGNVVAAINLFANSRNFFDVDELALLNEMGSDISFALQSIARREQLEYLSYYDVLTGLPNRVLFQDRLGQTLVQAQRNHWTVGVMFIDLDGFKAVNDTLGHTIGDKLLQLAAERLTDSVRNCDTVARFGGDEFAVILSDLASPQDAALVAQKILTAFGSPFQLDGNEVYVTASVGITLYPVDSEGLTTLIKNADAAMYGAKAAGRNNYQFYTAEMNRNALEKMQLETRLRRAIERQEFILHYQPKVDLISGNVSGLEALLRWQPPDAALVPPNEFIPLLEETGLIVPVGEWVLREACRQIMAWRRLGIASVPVAINLSGRQFQQVGLDKTFAGILGEYKLEPRWIEIEITESSLMRRPEDAAVVLKSLKALGMRVSVDDFGTGYSSLSYLKRFPLDALKVDRSFVRDITVDANDASITRAIVTMAHSLNLKVIAEGVETEEQLAFLRANRCDEVQGYLFSKPLPAADCGKLLATRRQLYKPDAIGGSAQMPTVLLVDDNPDMLFLLEDLLKADGYRILTASGAKAALDMLTRNKVGVIVSDQNMAEMQGVEFFKRVRVMYPNVVRIMLSGSEDAQTLAAAINEGEVYKFFVKGRDDHFLGGEIRKALRRDAPRALAA